MRMIPFVLASVVLTSFATPASAKSVYLTCVTNDPDWPPPLTIIIDEDRGEVRVSGKTSNGTSPNPAFTPTSVDFGFGLRRWHIDRINLALKTDDFFDSWNGVCKFGAPPKRAF